MTIIQNIADLHEREKPEIILVPQWPDKNGEPLKIYIWPFSVAEVNAFQKLKSPNEYEMSLDMVIFKACDENQRPIFKQADKNTLRHKTDMRIIIALAKRISKFLKEFDELGNSEGTPSAKTS